MLPTIFIFNLNKFIECDKKSGSFIPSMITFLTKLRVKLLPVANGIFVYPSFPAR
jgi:hypothetical protein